MELNHRYQRESFISFLNETLLNDFDKDIRTVNTQGLGSIKKAFSLGKSNTLDLQIFEFEFTGSSRKRIALTKEAFKLMRDSACYQALAVFYSANSETWRLSFLTADPVKTEKGSVGLVYSNPKRYSFLLGVHAKTNTPNRYLVCKGKIVDLLDLKKRFSIEVVNKDFYKEVSNAFTHLVGDKLKLPSTQSHSQTNLEFAVRLIGRVIFCWFLREKKSSTGHSLMPAELISGQAAQEIPDYYHKILEPIFFEILNRPIKSRKDSFANGLFTSIPYLNGGLFSPHEDDFYSYNDSKQAINHNLVVIPDDWFKSFFQVLETYNFTIDENTSYDEELSIDPEMLGRIFENLLAEINPETGESARKSTGSYYTPRIIVDYMVDESLLLYLKEKTQIKEEKLRALISYDIDDDLSDPLSDEEREKVTKALNSVKILDPACGSGAFPIGALQKIVFILQQIDPAGQLWFKNQIQNTPIELRRLIEREFQEKNFDYLRKLGIIRENIYGIDIQPIATEISRLRCFLTLIVDERIDETLDNRGIEPLPNLDFKFVTANSLIGLPETESSQGELFDNNVKIDQLKSLRDQYFNARNEERKDLMIEFSDLQSEMINELIDKHSFTGVAKADLTRKLTDWKPFKHKKTDWFDPEWMFGIKSGFDVVIANPPYVDSENMTKNDGEMREKYNSLYTTTKGNWDLFVVFIERGDQLLNNKGVLTYIVPNKLIGAKYSEAIRTYMLDRKIDTIRDYSNVKVFKDVSVYPVVFLLSKDAKKEESITVEKMSDLEDCSISNSIPGNVFYEDIYWDRYFVSSDALKLIFKISKFKKLYEYNKEVLGAATVNEAYELKKVIKDFTDEQTPFKKLINTGTIDPYRSKWGIKRTQYIKSSFIKPIILDNDLGALFPNRFAQANNKKIIVGGMTKRLEAFFDDGKYLAGKSTTIIIDNGRIDLIFLLAILNSKLISFWYKIYFKSLSLAGGFLRISNNEIKKIPIPESDKKVASQIIRLANEIMDITKLDNQDVNTDEKLNDHLNQIDQVVYNLYDLTSEEINIIEESFK